MGWKTAYRYRCSHQDCRARRTLPRPIEDYVRVPKRHHCGGPLTLDVYRQRKGASEGRPTCHCDGLHYPHRKGGSIWCNHHKTGPSERELVERYGYGGEGVAYA